MRSLRHSAAALIALALGACPLAGAATFFGPTLYQQFASDSPFNPGSYSYFHLESFEDGLLNTPGLSASGGVAAAPGDLTDSVDADDGVVDGFGTAGRSWYSNQVTTSIAFDFDAGVLGALPTHAGLVWTDVGITAPGGPATGLGLVSFEAFGPGLVSLGTIAPTLLGDGSVTGGTLEDRPTWTNTTTFLPASSASATRGASSGS